MHAPKQRLSGIRAAGTILMTVISLLLPTVTHAADVTTSRHYPDPGSIGFVTTGGLRDEFAQDASTYKINTTQADLINHYGCQNIFPDQSSYDDNGNAMIKLSVTYPAENILVYATNSESYISTCNKQLADNAVENNSSGEVLGTAELAVAQMIGWIIWLFISIGLWFLELAGSLIQPVATAGKFITNDLVVKGWPFVQGIANLGFIVALIAIAALTVLRIEIGGSIKRLLPRLLVAALLINFSLVIGGVLIDVSRLVMAVGWNMAAGENITNMGTGLIDKSGAVRAIFCPAAVGPACVNSAFFHKPEVGNWSHVASMAQAMIIIWGITGALLVVAAILFFRHVMLVLLLIVSPVAYLAAAMPGASKFASQWWHAFLKYVMYGPVIVFALALIVATQKLTDGIPVGNNGIYQNLLHVIIFIILIVSTATFGRTLGLLGAGATIGFVSGKAKQAGRLAGKGVYVGTGTRAITRNVRDTGKTITGNFAARARDGSLFGKGVGTPFSWAAKQLAGARRNEKGELKPGEDSFGSWVGRGFSPAKSQEAAAVKSDPKGLLGAGDGIYGPEHLTKGSVRSALTKQQIDVIINTGSPEQIRLLVSDTNVVRAMNKPTQTSLLTKPAYFDQMLRTLREIDRQDSGK